MLGQTQLVCLKFGIFGGFVIFICTTNLGWDGLKVLFFLYLCLNLAYCSNKQIWNSGLFHIIWVRSNTTLNNWIFSIFHSLSACLHNTFFFFFQNENKVDWLTMNDRISFSEDLVAVSGGKSPAQNDRNLTAAASAPSRLVKCRVAITWVWVRFWKNIFGFKSLGSKLQVPDILCNFFFKKNFPEIPNYSGNFVLAKIPWDKFLSFWVLYTSLLPAPPLTKVILHDGLCCFYL